MKCLSCDHFLSDKEASRKGLFSGEYMDLCEKCLSTIPDLEYTENPAASDKQTIDETVYEDQEQEE